MKFARTLFAVAGMSIAAAPALAVPVKTATSLSIARSVRAGAPVAQDKPAGGGTIAAIVGAAVVIAGIVVIASTKRYPAGR